MLDLHPTVFKSELAGCDDSRQMDEKVNLYIMLLARPLYPGQCSTQGGTYGSWKTIKVTPDLLGFRLSSFSLCISCPFSFGISPPPFFEGGMHHFRQELPLSLVVLVLCFRCWISQTAHYLTYDIFYSRNELFE